MPTPAPLSYRTPVRTVPPPLVALAGWLVPGAGYWVIGQRARGLVVGVTIVLLFLSGLLIGGVRAMEVPAYDQYGRYAAPQRGWVRELAQRPWFLAQVLTGPIGLGGAAASNWAARPAEDRNMASGYGEPRGALSHGRINEIAVLYTAVAGLLNLLAIIDAAHRAALPPDSAHAPEHSGDGARADTGAALPATAAHRTDAP